MKVLRERKLIQGALSAVAVVSLVFGLLVSGTSAPSTGKTVSATSKDWKVTIWVARTSTKAGTTIPATVAVDNQTGHQVEVTGCPGVVYGMVVGNAKIPNYPVIPAELCSTKLTPGIHVYHTKVLTDYQTCGGGNGAPKCGNPPRLSALPVGTYRTEIVAPGSRPAIPMPKPLTIILTR